MKALPNNYFKTYTLNVLKKVKHNMDKVLNVITKAMY